MVTELERSGAAGSAAAAALSASAPTPAFGEEQRRHRFWRQSVGRDRSPESDQGTPVGDRVDTLATGSDDGMGAFLPILLLVVLVGAVAFMLRARLRAGQPPTDS